ncbi:hypothetical protein BKA69DRAFT_1106518 [Paraphysoderma sedebokerense]|nr:hypothetical protein BKA69DRAFT_1106518 [Paraphysoderma sedebokerense]
MVAEIIAFAFPRTISRALLSLFFSHLLLFFPIPPPKIEALVFQMPLSIAITPDSKLMEPSGKSQMLWESGFGKRLRILFFLQKVC